MILKYILGLLLLFFSDIEASSISNQKIVDATKVELILSHNKVSKGSPFWAGIKIHIPKGKHIYAKDPGESGIATEVKFTLPDGVRETKFWPAAKVHIEQNIKTNIYEGTIILPSKLMIDDQFSASSLPLKVSASWLLCGSSCVPQQASFEISLPIADKPSSLVTKEFEELEKETTYKNFSFETSLLATIFLAFLGGLILNVMPCVFPILSIKALSLTRSKKALSDAVWYTLGILCAMLMLATIIIFFKTASHSIGWGFQMQYPLFVAGMLYLFFILGLNLSGVFELPFFSLNQPTKTSDFLTGFLITLLASPCTAPFMATAIGYTLTATILETYLVFTGLALGFAFPMLAINVHPFFQKLLPKPSKWMIQFKEFLAFPMYVSCVWLLWVLSQQVGYDAVLYGGLSLCFIAAGFWIAKQIPKFKLIIFVLSTIVVSLCTIQLQREATDYEKYPYENLYSKDKLEKYLSAGKPVFLHISAAWCITCKVNEAILETASLHSFFQEKGIEVLYADWTKNDPKVTQLLEDFGRTSIPMYIYFPSKEKPPIILPQILSDRIIKEHIKD